MLRRIATLFLIFALLAAVSTGCDTAGAKDIPYQAPEVAVETVGEKIVLSWEAIEDPRLKGYKVVVSRDNPNPKFPEDGYLYWITDCSVTSAVIDNADPYQDGDLDYLQPGEKYFFSVTAVYHEKNVPGNALKIVYPGEENPEDEDLPAPEVSAKTKGDTVVLSWKEIKATELQGYKVVISKDNPNPAYPEDGYLHYITDVTQTSVTIDNKTAYKDGDFGKFLTPEEEYYFSITAVYSDSFSAGNAVLVRFPVQEIVPPPPKEEKESLAPVVTGKVSQDKITLKWQAIGAKNLQGYKVVISKGNSKPKYPDDGYIYWFTDRNKTTAVINNSTAYKGKSDFGEFLTPGEKYYFSVTAVYDNKKVAGNALRLKAPLGMQVVDGAYKAPKVSYDVKPGKIILNWKTIDDQRLQGYKVVISKNNPNPAYPGDGYLYWISDRNKTTAVINNFTAYKNKSDFGEFLTPGEKYYFSVTAVYANKNVAGNALRLTVPEDMPVGTYEAPNVSHDIISDKIILKWDPIEDQRLQGYKVVISKNNPNPAYPGDGYLYWIENLSKCSVEIDISHPYNSKSDFGDFLTPGEEYYFSVTAVYANKNVAGNALRLTVPEDIGTE